jgi:hypothetical protein
MRRFWLFMGCSFLAAYWFFYTCGVCSLVLFFCWSDSFRSIAIMSRHAVAGPFFLVGIAALTGIPPFVLFFFKLALLMFFLLQGAGWCTIFILSLIFVGWHAY